MNKTEFPKLVSIPDIVSITEKERHEIWNLHRREPNFPKPLQFVNNGRTPIFFLDEVLHFFKDAQ
ncbi:hypothetical protein COK00_11735 [Bacillus cereus]|uniref:hypothetical protein n=1 Tax=Bacillus cereus group TaxID=86661 RepID=UPI000BF4F43A|nr:MULTISPECIES: hypothetical protein [Bacillus cereus group]MDA1616431.1 hypothetical protein [Bacillus cereus group sp. TH204-1LC]PFP65267.1 hypothetical protein COK00_11735 [Bacillus cereus]